MLECRPRLTDLEFLRRILIRLVQQTNHSQHSLCTRVSADTNQPPLALSGLNGLECFACPADVSHDSIQGLLAYLP